MTSLNRPARLNRCLLAIIGITLLTGGGLALATSLGWLPINPATPLAPGTELPPAWTLYAITGVAVLLGLLSLRWLAAQLARKPKTHTLAVVVTTEHDADLTDIRHRLDTHGLPRLRQALDLTSLPVTLEFRFTTKTGARV